MQRALERALDRADDIIESAQQSPPKRKPSSTGGKSLHEKLYDIYVEECGKEPEDAEELTRNVNLLEKLLQRESLPRLVVNLRPGEEGHKLLLRVESKSYSEIVRLPYGERDFFDYLNAEELPPVLVDALEKTKVNVFQSGCVITEVRDYRQCTKADRSDYQRRHVLLRPTMQTLAYDIQSITSDSQAWAQEDILSLESQLILATAEPLCLDPSVSVACIENKLLYNKQKMNMPAQDCSAASLNPQQELPSRPPSPEQRAWAPDQKSEESQAGEQDYLEMFNKNCLDMWERVPSAFEFPSDLDMDKYTEEDWPFQCDGQSIVWPELEAEDSSLFGYEAGNLSQTTKPSVMQSLNDPFISGKRSCGKVRCRRHMPHHYSSTGDHSYSFMPESQNGAGNATGESEKLVKKSDKCVVRVAQGSSGSFIPLTVGKAAEQPPALSVQSAVQGQGGQPQRPVIRVPSSSGNSSLGQPFTSQQASRLRIWELPSPAPAGEPASLPLKPPAEVRPVRTIPTATVTSASASQAPPVIQVKATSADSKAVQMMGSVPVVRTVVRGSNPVQGSSSSVGARTPSGVNPSGLPSGSQPQNARPAAPQAPSPEVIQYVLGNLSSLRPVSILWVPHGSDISSVLQQAQQQQQVLLPLIPQLLQQQPPTCHLLQPVVQISRVQSPSQPQRGLSTQQAAVINHNGVGGVLQPQGAELSQPGCAQARPGQRPSQQQVQLPAAFQQLPQSQLRITQLPEAVATASVQPAQTNGSWQAAGQAEGPGNGGPSTPKC